MNARYSLAVMILLLLARDIVLGQERPAAISPRDVDENPITGKISLRFSSIMKVGHNPDSLFVHVSRAPKPSLTPINPAELEHAIGPFAATTSALASRLVLDALLPLAEVGEQNDPAYATYKAGYQLILEEKWEAARKKLGELVSKHPKSKYVDDSEYWIAYSWKYDDRKRAIDAYRSFLKKYPDSNYYDDAVGDLERLEHPERTTPPEFPDLGPAIAPLVEQAKRIAEQAASMAERVAKEMSEKMQRQFGPGGEAFSRSPRKAEDPHVQMKIEALQALSRSGKDEQTFAHLKEIALDKSQPRELRETALSILSDYKGFDTAPLFLQIVKDDSDKALQKTAIYYVGRLGQEGDEKIFVLLKQIALDLGQSREIRESAFHSLRQLQRNDVLGVFVEIARNDPDEQVRTSAVYYIGEVGKKEPEKVVRVYRDLVLDQKQPRTVRESILYWLGNLKSEEASYLLLLVAQSDSDPRIQQSAIYQLSRVGGKDKSKSLGTLISLFESMPKDRTQSLESLLYAIASIGTDPAVDFLGNVARTNENYDLRRKAIYYLGNIGGQKARATLLEILRSK